MSWSVALISSSEIQKEEFISFLQELGAFIEDPKDAFDARISKGWQHIWIVLDPRMRSFNSFKADEPDKVEIIEQLLGRKIQTYITVVINDEPGSHELAIEFACAFAERWPCIVYNDDKIFTSQELFDLRSSGGNLW